MTGKVYGQPGNVQLSDTICPKIETYRKLVIAAEQKKILELQVVVLNQRISEKDSIISLLKFRQETTDQVIQTYEDEIGAMIDQRKVFEQAIKDTEKEVRRYKRKLFFRTAGGVMIAGVGAYLYLTK